MTSIRYQKSGRWRVQVRRKGQGAARSNRDQRIFPFNHKSAGSAFTRACKDLGIANLHFHDLRHEGTSRLFEAGFKFLKSRW
jgi:integrase